jgi:hypothetical protein
MVKSNRQFLTAVSGMAALLLLGSALAAPPQSRLQPRISGQTQQLDLRAPSVAAEAADRTASFPSILHRRNFQSQQQIPLPAPGSDEIRSRPGIQEFVQRARSEGIPLARLFESKSALVHLGLSPKGKPGLWLVQKTR